MTFLEDLLTFANPLSEGVELKSNLPPRKKSFSEKMGWKKGVKQPWEKEVYKIHRTKAGLSVVLRHDEDGSVLQRSELGPIHSEASVNPYLRSALGNLPDGLRCEECKWVSSSEKGSYIESMIRKPFSHIAFANTSTVVGDQIVELKITYGISGYAAQFCVQKKEGIIDVVAEVNLTCRFDSNGSIPEDNKVLERFDSKIDYEKSLKNLVEMMKQEEISPEDYQKITTLAYLV
ncbi:hypothetical protein GOV03_00510 [Candidatus Woesearchaeota archaeon]|nr:hypothetical protein [Candidatus Woesearchaeota archaeon]